MIVSGSNSYSARKKRGLDVDVIQATEFLSCLTAASRKFLRSISQYAGIMLDALTKALLQHHASIIYLTGIIYLNRVGQHSRVRVYCYSLMS